MKSHTATTDFGNVVQLATHKRVNEIADCKAVEAAMSQFASLMQQHGCRWVSLGGVAPNGTRFHVYSHSLDEESNPGVVIFVGQPGE